MRRDDVHPVLLDLGFELGGFPVRFYTYGLCMAVGLVLAVGLFANRARHHHDYLDLFLMAIFTFLGGLVGSKVLFILVNLDYYTALPPWQVQACGGCSLPPINHWLASGMVWYGGVLGAVPVALGFALARKMKFLLLADAASPALSLGHLWGRLGCFFAGCCYGAPTDMFWGVRFPPESVAYMEMVDVNILDRTARATMPLHPTQLYEVGAELMILLGLLVFSRYQRFKGQTAGLYLGCYGIFRFVVEFFRGDLSRGAAWNLSTSQWISLGLVALGGALFSWGYIWMRQEHSTIT